MKKKFVISAFVLIIIIIVATMMPNLKRYRILHVKEAENSQATTLRLTGMSGNIDINSDALMYLIDNFTRENPDIIIESELTGAADFSNRLAVDSVSGNMSDIILTYPGAKSKQYIEEKVFANLTPMLEEDKEWAEDIDSSLLYDVTYDGSVYGLPIEYIFQCMYINKSLFENYKVPVPKSFGELIEACKQLRNNGVVPIANSFQDIDMYLYQNILARIGGKFCVFGNIEDERVLQCHKQTLSYLQELYDAGAFSDDSFKINSEDAIKKFLRQDAAIIFEDTSLIGYINNNAYASGIGTDYNSQLEMLPFPDIEGSAADKNSLIHSAGMTVFVGRETWENEEKRAAVTRFIKYLTNDESMTYFCENTGAYVSKKTVLFSVKYYNGLLKKGNDLLSSTVELLPLPSQHILPEIWVDLYEQIPLVLLGKESDTELWNNLRRE